MLKKVRIFLKNNSPDWLNIEVNKDLLQNLTPYIKSSHSPATQTNHEPQHINVLPSPFRRGAGGEVDRSPEQVKSSLNKSLLGEVKRSQKKSDNSAPQSGSLRDRPLSTENCLLFPTPGTPHWRRIRQVFVALDNAPANYTYNQLIEYVRQTTGQGCSRKLISKWKKQKSNQNIPDNNSGDRHIEERTAAISLASAIVDIPSTVNSLQLTDSKSLSTDLSSNGDNCSLMTVKAWSYLTAAGIMVSLVGCEIIPFNNNRLTENVAIARTSQWGELNSPPVSSSVTAPITPLTPIPERIKNRLEPRNIKIELTLSNPQDLKVKPGDKISAGQVLSDRASERNRLQAKKKQLQLSLLKLNLPLTPIPQPKPIPEISPLPPVSYAEEEAAIKLHKQKLTEAERAIANQKEKINQIRQLLNKERELGMNNQPSISSLLPIPDSRLPDRSPSSQQNHLKLILSHERANLKNLEAAQQSAQIQLEVQESKLTTAKEQRAYLEYQRQLEQTRRAYALEQQQQAIASQESERERLLAEREYSKAQIETQIQTLDYQIEQLSTVRAPYEGTIKKVKWTGQSDHNLTAVVTLAVNDSRSTIANSTSKPTPDREAKQSTQAQP